MHCLASRVSFYFKVEPELNLRYAALKYAGYLKSKDINAMLEARLKELLDMYMGRLPTQNQDGINSRVSEALDKRYNTKTGQDNLPEKTPTPTDPLYPIPVAVPEDVEELPDVVTQGEN